MKTSYLLIVSMLICGLNGQAQKDDAKTDPNAELTAKAEKGDAVAQYDLAILRVTGGKSEQAATEACKWLKLAAEQGHPRAQYSLGVRYIRGEGVEENFSEAAKWFRKAAHQGLSQAQYSLAIRYTKGKGVPEDFIEAYKWFIIAEKGGKEHAANGLKNIEKANFLTAEQIEEAKARAAEFVPQENPRFSE